MAGPPSDIAEQGLAARAVPDLRHGNSAGDPAKTCHGDQQRIRVQTITRIKGRAHRLTARTAIIGRRDLANLDQAKPGSRGDKAGGNDFARSIDPACIRGNGDILAHRSDAAIPDDHRPARDFPLRAHGEHTATFDHNRLGMHLPRKCDNAGGKYSPDHRMKSCPG